MSAKPEAKEAAPDKGAPDKGGSDKAPPAEKGAAAAAPAAAPGKLGLFAAIGAVVLAPVLSLGVAQFVLLPKLEKKLALPPAPGAAAAEAEAPAAEAPAKAEGKGGKADPPTFEFSNVVVNLAG